jgi:hypothetical protein
LFDHSPPPKHTTMEKINAMFTLDPAPASIGDVGKKYADELAKIAKYRRVANYIAGAQVSHYFKV